MQFSTSVIAALLGFGALVRGRPQEISGGSTTPNQIPDLSGSDISDNVNFFNDETRPSVDQRVAFNTDGSAKANGIDNTKIPDTGNEASDETGKPVDLVASGETGISTDQSSNIASADNPLGLPVETWENDKKLLEQVKSGKLIYAIYKIYEKNIIIIPTVAVDEGDKQRPWLHFITDLTDANNGYAIYHYKDKIIPLFFAWSITDENFKEVKEMAETFVDFNRALGLGDTPLDIITNDADYNRFLNRIGQARFNRL